MPTGRDEVSVAGAAARWLGAGGLSAAVRDARRSDLCVLARTLADMLDRPLAPTEGSSSLRELGRLRWADLDPLLLAEAIAAFGVDRAPVTNRRLVTTWSSFFEWLREGCYPLPRAKLAPLAPPESRLVQTPQEIGVVVAEVIRGGRGTHDAWPERDRAMVGVIVAGSLSLTKVSMLRVRDVQREGDRTWLQSRTRQGRTSDVELPLEVQQALDVYLASRRVRVLADTAADLFVRARSGKPDTADALRYLYVGWFKRAGLVVPRDPPATALRAVYVDVMREIGTHASPVGEASHAPLDA